MGRRNRIQELFIDEMAPKGVSGLNEQGIRWTCKGAAIGDRVSIRGGRKKKGTLLEVLELSPHRIDALCPHFLSCGGCQFQHMPLELQRSAKEAMIKKMLPDFSGTLHPIRGDDSGFHYRNKLELSFGTRQFFAVAPDEKPPDGSFLGMHPWGWYSKIVPLSQCPLAETSIDLAIQLLSTIKFDNAWNTYQHIGKWRNIVLREGGGLSVAIYTSSEAESADIQPIVETLKTLPNLRAVLWIINDGIADVAQGTLKEVLYGRDDLEIPLGDQSMLIPYDGFAQVNHSGAQILFDTIMEAVGSSRGTLLDLYCGSGAIGIALSKHFDTVIGVEIQERAIQCAIQNAHRMGIEGQWIAAPVEEALQDLLWHSPATIIVDPPRNGLYPSAARFLAEQCEEVLVYVACNPKSLARDRAILEAGNWNMEAVWTVDLFPQTPHTECVARFVQKDQS